MHIIRRGLQRFSLRAATQNIRRWAAVLGMRVAPVIGSSLLIGGVAPAQSQSVPVTAGYRDYFFGGAVNNTPTGEKPQSKLWWNDGIWWGNMWDVGPKTNTVHRFNVATQSWTSTGAAIDDRKKSKADALWDGQRLYIVSQIYTQTPAPATNAESGRLYRYSYNAAAQSYSLDAGFPVLVNNSISEALVLAKDSTGKLWVTWTEGGKVRVNRSLGNDLTWGTPFDLPVQGSDTKIDDISSILAFGNNKIGIMWSNQNDKKSYFAIHIDGNADGVWQPRETALADPSLGAISYDHIHLKPACDNSGNVFAVTKTNLTQSSLPLVYMLKRDAAGVWTRYLVSTVNEGYVRPILLIDEEQHKAYVFAMSEVTGTRIIYMKSTSLDNIAFAPGMGTPFIQSATDIMIINPTSTKQCVNSSTGLLVLAADQDNRYYLHNYLALGGAPSQYTLTVNTIGSGNVTLDPAGGTYNAGTLVTLTAVANSGFQFSGWSGALSGSGNPATITMNADKSVTATFTSIAPGNEILHQETKTGGSADQTTVTTSAGLTGVQGHLYLAAVSTRPKMLAQSISGLGLSWTLVQSQCSGRNGTSIQIWKAQGTPGGNGVVTATFANAPRTAAIAVSRYSGVGSVNLVGNVISGNTNGMNGAGACNGGVDNSAYSFNLNTSVNNAVVYGAATMYARTHTPGTGFTERGEVQQANGVFYSSVAVQDLTAAFATSVTVAGSFNGAVDWAMAALELQPPQQYVLATNIVGSGGLSLNPPGGTYGGGTLVTLTASPASGFQFGGWGGALSGVTNPASIVMDGNKDLTATFVSNDQIIHQETQTGGSSSSTTVATSANLTGVQDQLYLAAISTRPKMLAQSLSGLGLSWTLVTAQCSGRNSTSIQIWKAQGTPSGNGAVTATFANPPNAAVIAVSRYSGVASVNPLGTVITGNSNGINGAGVCTGGVDHDAYSFNLNTTVANAVVYGAVALNTRTHTPGAGYAERGEIQSENGALKSAVAIEDKAVATVTSLAVDGSFSGSADWAMAALELQPPQQHMLVVNIVGSGSVNLDPPGGTYDAGTLVTLTANPASGFQFEGWSGDVSEGTNPATVTMDNDENVTAAFVPNDQIVHQETQTGGSSNSATVTTSANLTGVQDHLYLAAISTRPKMLAESLSGLGLDWSLVEAQCSGRNSTSIQIWKAQGTPSGNGAVTATFTNTPKVAVIAVSRYSGVASAIPLGSMISGNTNGMNGAGVCTGGADNDAYSFNLNITVEKSVVYGAVAMNTRTHTPGAGYAERGEVQSENGVLMSAVAIEDKTAATVTSLAVDGSFSGSADWAMISLELKPQAALGKGGTKSTDGKSSPASVFQLYQNYPNPFNPGTMINFTLPEAGKVRVNIYDEIGHLVRTLADQDLAAGPHALYWNGRNQSGNPVVAGVYFYRIVVWAGSNEPLFTETRRMTLLK